MSWTAISKNPHGRNNAWVSDDMPGVVVRHCGHQTALRPYYINAVPARAFPTLKSAFEFAETRLWLVVGEVRKTENERNAE